MTSRFKPLPSSSVVEIAREVLDTIRENTRLQEVLAAQQNRLTEVLARIMSMYPEMAAAPAGKADVVTKIARSSVQPERSTREEPYTSQIKGRGKTQILSEAAQRHSEILDLWADLTVPQHEIARRFAMNPRTIRRIIEKARASGDERAIVRPHHSSLAISSLKGNGRTQRKDVPDLAAGEKVGSSPAAADSGQSGTEHTEEAQDRNEPVSASPVSAATAGGVSASPAVRAGDDEAFTNAVVETVTTEKPVFMGMDFSTAEPVTVEVKIPACATPSPTAKSNADFMYVPGGVIGWDEKALKIAGPKGVLDADRPILLSLKHMADGRLYDIGTLAEKGGWEKKDKLYECLRSWCTRLPKVGVELVFVSKELFKLRALED